MSRRESSRVFAVDVHPGIAVFASESADQQIAVTIGRLPNTKVMMDLLSATAREFGEALIRAANHYDAETARLAAESQKVAA